MAITPDLQAAVGPGVGLLLVTHGRLGALILGAAEEIIGSIPLPSDVLEVRPVQDGEVLMRQGQRMIERLDRGGGVLMLTDVFGSTPANIAARLNRPPHTQLVAGLNLPMMLRVLNYASLDLSALARAAVEGGQRGIVACCAAGAVAP